MKPKRHTLLAALCCAAFAGPGSSQPAADAEPAAPDATPDVAPPPAEVGLIVNDLVVMQADLYGNTMNDAGDFETTLFNGSPRRRDVSPDPNATPMPLGLITLGGAITAPTDIRIDIAGDGGRFLGHWPKGVAGSNFLVWYDVQQVETPAGRMRIDAEHWLASLRDTEGPLCFNSRKQVDRFFAYDATFPFQPTLKVEGTRDDGYTITGDPPPGTQYILVVRREENNWLAGATPQDALAGPIELQPINEPGEAIAPLLAALREQGYPDSQVDAAAEMLTEIAFGDASMSLIYVMGQEAMDGLLPLTIEPAPQRIHRAGIVVVNNVEPDIAGTVGGLIEQLGDDQWARRDAAQRALIEMDRAAIAVVREHADHTDPEVAYRIEQIIAAYDKRHE